MAKKERPRERLLQPGSQHLTETELLGIKVYDHIILAGKSYRSLADEGLI